MGGQEDNSQDLLQVNHFVNQSHGFCRVKELREGDMFGHEEIYDSCNRKCKVTSIEESEVFYMNVADFK